MNSNEYWQRRSLKEISVQHVFIEDSSCEILVFLTRLKTVHGIILILHIGFSEIFYLAVS